MPVIFLNRLFLGGKKDDKWIRIVRYCKKKVEYEFNKELLSEAENFQKKYYDNFLEVPYRCGYYKRGLKTLFGDIVLNVPRFRKYKVKYSVFEKYKRESSDYRNKLKKILSFGLSKSYINNLSVFSDVSFFKISKVRKEIKYDLLDNGVFVCPKFVYVDAIYIGGFAVFVALGLYGNKKRLLSYKAYDSESLDNWIDFFYNLFENGITAYNGLKAIISDRHQSITSAFKFIYSGVEHLGCIFHFFKNIRHIASVNNENIGGFIGKFRKVFYNFNDVNSALDYFYNDLFVKYKDKVFFRYAAKHLDFFLKFYNFDKKYWQFIRTNNYLERLNKEIRRNLKNITFVRNKEEAEVYFRSSYYAYKKVFLENWFFAQNFLDIPIMLY